MSRVIEVPNCVHCLYRLATNYSSLYATCLKNGRQISKDDRLTPFPSWCPLPESKEDSK